MASLLAGYRHVEDFSHNTGDPGEMDSRRKTIFRSENLQATIFTSFVSIYDNFTLLDGRLWHLKKKKPKKNKQKNKKKYIMIEKIFFNDSHVCIGMHTKQKQYENNNKLKKQTRIENGKDKKKKKKKERKENIKKDY